LFSIYGEILMKSYGNYPDESTEWWEDSEMIMNDDAVDAFEWDLIPEEEEEEKNSSSAA
jgi:hypothetical protein